MIRVQDFLRRAIRKITHTLAWRLFYFFPIKNDRIIVSNFLGKGYADSPKYIINEVCNQKQGLDIIWIIN